MTRAGSGSGGRCARRFRTSHVDRAVTVGNKAPVPGLASKGAQRVSPGYSRLALADAQQRYDDAIGDFPV